jgi:hypothetical protein
MPPSHIGHPLPTAMPAVCEQMVCIPRQKVFMTCTKSMNYLSRVRDGSKGSLGVIASPAHLSLPSVAFCEHLTFTWSMTKRLTNFWCLDIQRDPGSIVLLRDMREETVRHSRSPTTTTSLQDRIMIFCQYYGSKICFNWSQELTPLVY